MTWQPRDGESFRLDTSILEEGVFSSGRVCSSTCCVGTLLSVVGTKAATGDDAEIDDDD